MSGMKIKKEISSTKKNIYIVVLIILFILFLMMYLSNNKKDNTEQKSLKSVGEPVLITARDINEKDELYYYNIVGSIVQYLYDGYSMDEAISAIMEDGYTKDEIELIIDELGIDWETQSIENSNSQYYDELVEYGVIIDNDSL